MESLLEKSWHHLPQKEILDLLGSDAEEGLEILEAKARQERFGPNEIEAVARESVVKRFFLQFHQPLIYILLLSSAVTLALEERTDAAVIFGVVFFNAIVGFVQERKALRAIEALSKSMSATATVIRGGETYQVSAADLVPGDLVTLSSGDKVPADLRLIEVRDLRVEEAPLTGESEPVNKGADPLEKELPLAERKNMAFATTLVTYGRGKGLVVATGNKTEVGKVSRLVAEAAELQTPLLKKIASFSRRLLYVILFFAGLLFWISTARGQSVVEAFKAAVALAVGAIPEGLPAAFTVILAIGVSRMARRGAIIRNLPSVETLGSTTVICSDKTGTLTENQMTVQEILSGGHLYEVAGRGYSAMGAITSETDVSLEAAPLVRCLLAGKLCNEARLVPNEEGLKVQGDPTEAALLVSAQKLRHPLLRKSFERLDVLPFESEHQYMATLHPWAEGERIIFVKGAVEVLIERCDAALVSTERGGALPVGEIRRTADAMASRGLRVLALAQKIVSEGRGGLSHADVAEGLHFLGLQAMIDPPRQEAIRAVTLCQRAGIQVKMITGDHALTAMAIARKLGLASLRDCSLRDCRSLSGAEMARLHDKDLIDHGEEYAVFARVSPEQKLRLVRALQARGHVVAMTGDGVNDAPALKQANIGVAMGRGGTEAAKEASDMILTDDNFATIEAAVEEGRAVYENLVKFLNWTLPTNLGEGLAVLVAVFLGDLLPILPIQILYINMTTALLLGLMLAFEPKEPGIMSRPPRNPEEGILTRPMLVKITLVGGLLVLFSFLLFAWELKKGGSVASARTLAVNAFVVIGTFYLFNCRALRRSVFEIGLLSNVYCLIGAGGMLVLQMLFTYHPWFHAVFQSAPIDALAWAKIALAGLFTFVLMEGIKRLRW